MASFLVHSLGAELGRTLMKPARDNPNGFWENRRVADLNDKVLASAGNLWDWVREPAIPQSTTLLEQFARDASRLLANEFPDGADFIALKDPRLCFTQKLWREFLVDRGYSIRSLAVFRHPAEVAASIHERNGIPVEEGYALWVTYLRSWLATSEDSLALSYDFLLDNPMAAMNSIARHLNIQCKRTLAAAAEQVEKFIAPALRHHRAAATDDSSDTHRFFTQELLPLCGGVIRAQDRRALASALEMPALAASADANEDVASRLSLVASRLRSATPRAGSGLYAVPGQKNPDLQNRRMVASIATARRGLASQQRDGTLKNELIAVARELADLQCRLHAESRLHQSSQLELAANREQLAEFTAWLEQLATTLEQLSVSRRWRLGDWLISTARRLLGKPQPRSPLIPALDVVRDFRNRHSTPTVTKPEPLNPPPENHVG